MGIEINNTNTNNLAKTNTTETQSTHDKAKTNHQPQTSDSATITDSIELTRSGVNLNKLERTLDDQPVIDKQRIDAIKKAIATGEYTIDDKSIASKLIRLDSQLI